MSELANGICLPHYVELASTAPGGAESSLQDTTMRLGEVVAAYSPSDSNNKGPTRGKQWVYVVNVTYRDGAGMRSVVPYRCTVANLFGGMGDHLRHTVRRTDAEGNNNFTKGAQVLVLCPNGDKGHALIISGVRHTQDLDPEPDDTFLDFVFNGVQAAIGADGSLSITVPGPTKLDGSPGDRAGSNKGSRVTMAKSGDITISDESGEEVVVSPGNKSITVKTGSQSTTAQDSWTLKASAVKVEADSVTVKSSKIGLGNEHGSIGLLDEVVVGSGIDTLTGIPYFLLGNTSNVVKVKKG